MIIRAGNVSLKIYPWKHPSGRDYFRFDYTCPETGKLKQVTRSTQAKTKEAARNKCIELSNGQLSLDQLPPTTIARLRRLLAHDATLSFADNYLTNLSKAHPTKSLADALAEFMASKRDNRGSSLSNVTQLHANLSKLPAHCGDGTIISNVTPAQIETYCHGHGTRSPRYRANIRRSLVTFFLWSKDQGYLPEGKTAPEKTSKPILTRSIPTTYTRAELEIILKNCRPEHKAWFALQAWAGIRGDELLSPSPDKSPLDWSDIDLEKRIITIRPETAKTKQKRVIPICAALRSYLFPLAKPIGQIALVDPRVASNGKSDTIRLGKLLPEGWKQNALRHSFISYRSAQIGLGRTAMEAGNSESEAKRSYNDAMSEADSLLWFSELSQNTLKKP